MRSFVLNFQAYFTSELFLIDIYNKKKKTKKNI